MQTPILGAFPAGSFANLDTPVPTCRDQTISRGVGKGKCRNSPEIGNFVVENWCYLPWYIILEDKEKSQKY